MYALSKCLYISCKLFVLMFADMTLMAQSQDKLVAALRPGVCSVSLIIFQLYGLPSLYHQSLKMTERGMGLFNL